MSLLRRRSHLPLTVCCISDRSPQQMAAALQPLRGLVSEVRIGLVPDHLGRRPEPADYRQLASTVIALDDLTREQRRATLQRGTTTEWVLHLDGDEVPAPSLVAELAAATSNRGIAGWRVARKWISVDGSGWHDERPWWPDAEPRLLRHDQDPSSLPADATGVLLAPLLVGTAALRSRDERERAVLRREVIELGGPGTLREDSVRLPLPDRYAQRPPIPLPADEHVAVQALLAGSRVPARRPKGRGRVPNVPHVDAVRLEERDLRFRVGQPREVAVRLSNTTGQDWSSRGADDEPRHLLSYHWHLPNGDVIEGARTQLPGRLEPGAERDALVFVIPPDEPGRARLSIQVVHEWVAWFDGEASADVEIAPLEELPSTRHVPTVDAAIPKIIHRIWLGNTQMPEAHARYGETWERLHPDWEVRLWTDADAPMPPCTSRARSVSEISDIVRVELLRLHGGVYVDTDIECLRPIDELVAGVEAFSAYEVPGRLCPALMGATPAHPAFERMSELTELVAGHGNYPQSVSTVFSTFVLEAFPEVTLFGPDRFYPRLWDGRENVGDDPPYADHHWAISWLPDSA